MSLATRLCLLFSKNLVTATRSLQFVQRNINLDKKPTHFLSYNDIIYPVQGFDEERRPAYVCHQKCNIRYTPKKMTYVAWLIRGMSVDEAIKQLSFVLKKGGAIVKEAILEAQAMAVEHHNVEFKSNLWVAESFTSKAYTIKGKRKHKGALFGEVRYTYCHYFVRLEEGEPPKDYYKTNHKSSSELLEDWKEQMRRRKIPNSL
ncbi:PREDICTED: 39S ribosomal protein L22, mitochondrial [Ceratosolen solmsi marchali]|uniref:Large ribosomal subunit protein uL22m n=1 Tax=Ceratosolen solmsi marchali TaxID=326594 RepID=A0AAJ6YHU9_9HYME|nr:PREDICTED: 39S ribosomal protein L22, mitochondrial [Ceratosolen solmsi marchali]